MFKFQNLFIYFNFRDHVQYKQMPPFASPLNKTEPWLMLLSATVLLLLRQIKLSSVLKSTGEVL